MRIKKLLCLAIALLVACCAFMSCKNGGDGEGESESGSQSSESVRNGEVADKAEHYATANRLHDVNTDFSNPAGTFVANGETQYKIVTSRENITAAKFIAKHVYAATKAEIEIDYSGSADVSHGKCIVLGLPEASESAGITIPDKATLGTAGYSIKTVGDDVYIDFYTDSGAQMAAIAFLREVLGYDMLAEDLVVYEKDGSVMPQMSINERPDYEFRVADNKMNEDAKYGFGFTIKSTMLMTNGADVHNMFDFVDESDLEDNPKWFSSGVVMGSKPIGQPCFTAHGDKDSYEAFTTKVAVKMLEYLAQNPNAVNVRISPNDVTEYNSIARCTCKACIASYNYYGGTLGGAILSFANDVSEKVRALLDETTDERLVGRTVNIVVLAYGQNIEAPVKKEGSKYIFGDDAKGIPVTRYDFDENGEGSPAKDENNNEIKLVCGKNVNIEFAASAANWIHSFYEDENSSYAAAVQAWAGLGGGLYVWAYEISFNQYLYPYNNYDILVENLRYFKNNNGNYIYPQGTYENRNCSGFAKFREYVNSHALFDVNVNYNELKTKYFKYCYGAGGEYMLEYFDRVQMNLKLKENITGGRVHGLNLSGAGVWEEEMVDGYMDLIEKAYEAVEEAKADDDNYDAYKNHILIESLFPRYVLCTTYAENQGATQLDNMRRNFVSDFYALGNVTHCESKNISEIFVKEWGIS